MNYSPELKEAMLRRMLPPNNESITKISKEEGISEQTLRNRRDSARANGTPAPGTDFQTSLPDHIPFFRRVDTCCWSYSGMIRNSSLVCHQIAHYTVTQTEYE